MSRLPEFSTDLTPFDLPDHEDDQVVQALETPRVRKRKVKLLRREYLDGEPRPFRPGPDVPIYAGARERANGAKRAGDDWTPPIAALAHEDGAHAPTGGLPKRLLDIAIAATALIMLSPLLLFVALLIRVTMGQAVLFSQKRAGFAGRQFRCFKFRTMVADAEAALRLHLVSNPQAAREWQMRQKLQHDPRVTTLGRLLRRSSIDELPQLLCVLKGDMSCVGPRPIVEAEIGRYGAYWAEYVKARPGLTGIWQVSGRNRLSYERRVALDRYYVRKWSFWRDIWILIRTIPAVLRPDDTA